jgi:hypothetical protein
MLNDFLPTCPRLHPGMMVPDDSYRYGQEWVCRVCGTRLYGNDQGGAELPTISSEMGQGGGGGNFSGKPRNNTTHHRLSKDRGGRSGRGGKWYE